LGLKSWVKFPGSSGGGLGALGGGAWREGGVAPEKSWVKSPADGGAAGGGAGMGVWGGGGATGEAKLEVALSGSSAGLALGGTFGGGGCGALRCGMGDRGV
jgi:hypothetical protein